MTASPAKTVAVALGSGGARGYAHIGVLEVLAERGYDVVSIAGTSMGALVGGVAAAGRLADFREWSVGLSQRDVLLMLDPRRARAGAIRAERVMQRVREMLGEVSIEDLPVAYTAVATDLEARREVWFQRGPLDVAIRASIAIPSVITPVVVDGRLLVDGGLMNPVPIEPTVSADADFTVAVSLAGERDRFARTPAREVAPSKVTEWAGRLRRNATKTARDPEIPDELSMRDVLVRSLDTMSALITRYRLAANPPDVLVTVPADACRTVDFHLAVPMIELGRELASAALDRAGR